MYGVLLRAFQLGDTGEAREIPLLAAVTRRPLLATTFLGAGLVSELAAIFYPFTSIARLTVGGALLGLHGFCRLMLNISFRENALLLAAFSFPFVEWWF